MTHVWSCSEAVPRRMCSPRRMPHHASAIPRLPVVRRLVRDLNSPKHEAERYVRSTDAASALANYAPDEGSRVSGTPLPSSANGWVVRGLQPNLIEPDRAMNPQGQSEDIAPASSGHELRSRVNANA
jgi:hypothetical protein